jgi:hypothetical protein
MDRLVRLSLSGDYSGSPREGAALSSMNCVTLVSLRIGRIGAGTSIARGSVTMRGSWSRTVSARVSTTQPPAAMTLRTQSVSRPYVSAITKPSPERKMFTGVRWSRPDRRPVCVRMAKPGSRPANGPVTWFVTLLLKRPSHPGSGIRGMVSASWPPGRLASSTRRGGRVVRQRPAKPRTPVQFRSPPRAGTMAGLGRLAQGESASLTRKRSEVQIL